MFGCAALRIQEKSYLGNNEFIAICCPMIFKIEMLEKTLRSLGGDS
jgi:hypothetical protein